MIELTMVIIASSILFGFAIAASKLIRSARIANAINITSKADFADDDSLVLWIETSHLNKDLKDGDSVDNLIDLSKNRLVFEPVSTKPVLKKNKSIDGVNGIYFNNSGKMRSDNSFNLKDYTVFIVAIPNNYSSSSTYIINGPFSVTPSNLSGANDGISVIRRNKTKREIKRGNKKDFVSLTNQTPTRQQYIYIGGSGSVGFSGNIFEIIVFNKYLNDKEITEIESYLYNKYKR